MTNKIERAEQVQEVIFTFTNFLRNVYADDVTPAAAIELSRILAYGANILAQIDMCEEHFAETVVRVRPEAMGHLLLQEFGEGRAFNVERKIRLLQIAEVLGPDNIESFRRDVAFIVKMNGFR